MHKSYAAEVRERSVRIALDRLAEDLSMAAACHDLAPEFDVGTETLRNGSCRPGPTLGTRGLGISNVFVMHKGTDIPKDSPGMAIIQEAQTIVVYRQSRPEDALWCQETFGFAPESAKTIETLRDGHFIFKYGSHPETHVQHIRSAWEISLTNTDEALAAGSVG